jgi:hypothetical protein
MEVLITEVPLYNSTANTKHNTTELSFHRTIWRATTPTNTSTTTFSTHVDIHSSCAKDALMPMVLVRPSRMEEGKGHSQAMSHTKRV